MPTYRKRLLLLCSTTALALTLVASPVDLSRPGDGFPVKRAQAEDSSCFVAGTLVLMADGTQRPIETLAIGDRVLGRRGRVNLVLGVERTRLGQRRLYAFNDGRPFVTAEHPFLTAEGWKALDPERTRHESPTLVVTALILGDRLCRATAHRVGKAVEANQEPRIVLVQSCAPLRRLTAVEADPDLPLFNLLLDQDHSYVADGWLVHNKGEDSGSDDAGSEDSGSDDSGSDGSSGDAGGDGDSSSGDSGSDSGSDDGGSDGGDADGGSDDGGSDGSGSDGSDSDDGGSDGDGSGDGGSDGGDSDGGSDDAGSDGSSDGTGDGTDGGADDGSGDGTDGGADDSSGDGTDGGADDSGTDDGATDGDSSGGADGGEEAEEGGDETAPGDADVDEDAGTDPGASGAALAAPTAVEERARPREGNRVGRPPEKVVGAVNPRPVDKQRAQRQPEARPQGISGALNSLLGSLGLRDRGQDHGDLELSGPPLSADEERDLIAKGWRTDE